MSRTSLNFVVDVITALVMLSLIATGLLMRFVLPPGSSRLAVWGMGRHDWGELHFWLAAAVAAVAAVHVALHWTWVCNTVRRGLRPHSTAEVRGRVLYGVLFVLLLVGTLWTFVWLARGSIAPSGGRQEHDNTTHTRGGRQDDAGMQVHSEARPSINGSLSLAEAADLTGRSLEELKQRLELPADTPAATRLRAIADEKGLEMSELRRRITQ